MSSACAVWAIHTQESSQCIPAQAPLGFAWISGKGSSPRGCLGTEQAFRGMIVVPSLPELKKCLDNQEQGGIVVLCSTRSGTGYVEPCLLPTITLSPPWLCLGQNPKFSVLLPGLVLRWDCTWLRGMGSPGFMAAGLRSSPLPLVNTLGLCHCQPGSRGTNHSSQ